MSLSDIATAVGLFVLFVGTIIAAYAHFKTKLVQTTGELWKAEAEALTVRLNTVEEEARSSRDKIAVLERENQILRSLVSEKSAVAEMTKAMAAQHSEVMAAIWAVTSMLRGNP